MRSPLALAALPCLAFAQSSPDPKLLATVRDAVFEVVVPKPPDTGVVYDKPLPVDLVPYRERKDSMISIGSAFAVGRDTLVSAAHVLALGGERLFGEPRLRSVDGRVWPLGDLLKYSNHRDFAVFRVPGLSVQHPLRPAPSIELNQTVYAVGNALGEGIILRDGLLTSRTEEQDSGAWSWIRFSAPASPGNSGGPLVDAKGALLGVVLRKSENENLNYALPWEEVAAAPSRAVLYEKMRYVLPNFRDVQRPTVLDASFPLPASWAETDRRFWETQDSANVASIAAIQAEHRDEFFPRGKSGALFLQAFRETFPSIVFRRDDGLWANSQTEDAQKSTLPGNGWMSYADIGGFGAARVRVPDSLDPSAVLRDGRAMMDLFLAGTKLPRQYAGVPLRIRSLGAPVVDTVHIDRWGRRWIARAWRLPWVDAVLLVRALPEPGGWIQISDFSPAHRSDIQRDLDYLENHIVAGYYGTFRQWDAFLADKPLLPDFLRRAELLRDSKAVTFRVGLETSPSTSPTGGLELSVPRERLPFTENGDITVGTAFVGAPDNTRMVVGAVTLGQDEHTEDWVRLERRGRPSSDLDPSWMADWEHMSQGRTPYDRRPITQGNATFQSGPAKANGTVAPASESIWMLSAKIEGDDVAKRVKALWRAADEGTRIPPSSDF